MYPKYAELLQHPSWQIFESSIPALRAVVTARIQKLAMNCKLITWLTDCSKSFSHIRRKFEFCKWLTVLKFKALLPLNTIHAIATETRHSYRTCHFSNKMFVSFPKWSVLDFFSVIFIMLESLWSSILTSPHTRWWDALKDYSLWIVTSPSRKKPKKNIIQAAHVIATSGFVALDGQWLCNCCRMAGVMGRQMFTLIGHWD